MVEFDPDVYLKAKVAPPPAFDPGSYLVSKAVAFVKGELASLKPGPTEALRDASKDLSEVQIDRPGMESPGMQPGAGLLDPAIQIPHLTGDTATKIIEAGVPGLSVLHKIAPEETETLVNRADSFVADTVSGMTSPAGVLALGTGAAAPAAVKAMVGAGFGATMALDIPEKLKAYREETDPQKKMEHLGDLLETAGMIGLAGSETGSELGKLKTELQARRLEAASPTGEIPAEALRQQPPPIPDEPTIEPNTPKEVILDGKEETHDEKGQQGRERLLIPAKPDVPPVEAPASKLVNTAVRQGDVTVPGSVPFQSHADIKMQAARSGTDVTDGEHGFVDENGKFLSRTEAADAALKSGRIDQTSFDRAMAREGEDKGLHSEDMRKEDAAVPVTEPASVVPKKETPAQTRQRARMGTLEQREKGAGVPLTSKETTELAKLRQKFPVKELDWPTVEKTAREMESGSKTGGAVLIHDLAVKLGVPIEQVKAAIQERIKSKGEVQLVRGDPLEAPGVREAETHEDRLAAIKRASIQDGGDDYLKIQFHEPSVTHIPPGREPPGAASVTQPLSTGSNLRQLTEIIGSEPRKPFRQQIQDAITRIPDQIQRSSTALKDQAVDATTTALLKAKALGTLISRKFTQLDPYTDFSRAKGAWDHAVQYNDRSVLEYANQIRRAVPDATRREGITNWIQADGDKSVLSARSAASKTPSLRRGYEAALKLTDAEKDIARNISSYLDAMMQEGLDAGIFRNGGVENYVTQIWKQPNPVTQRLMSQFGNGKLPMTLKFAKQRIFDSYFEGEQAGFKPATKDIGALLSVYDQAFGRTKAARAFVKQLQNSTASDGRPLVEIIGSAHDSTPQPPNTSTALLVKPRIKPSEAADYKALNHPALRGWKWISNDSDGTSILLNGDMVVHPEIANDLKDMLGSSLFRTYEHPMAQATQALLKGQSVLKATKLSLSAFHQTNVGMHAAFHRVNPFAPVELNLDAPEQAALTSHGLKVADHRAMQDFSEGLSGSGGLLDKVPGIGPVLQHYQKWLFQEYIPRLKMSMALEAQERNMKRYSADVKSGKVTEDQILELTARQSNQAFGEQNYRYMARNPTFQDLLRIGFLAPDFLESRGRFVGNALTKYGGEQRAALALMVGSMYVGARVLNKALDGDYHWDKPFALKLGNTEYGIRSIAGDAQNAFNDPRRFIYNRLSPITRGVTEAVTGRDSHGIKRSTFEQFKDLASWLVPITLEKGGTGNTTRADAIRTAAGIISYTPPGQGVKRTSTNEDKARMFQGMADKAATGKPVKRKKKGR